ncbi:MAG: TIGR04086 family membrane protein [Lachnospiraceae bacterium]|jgi:putative membrane protein (TIGR04086 family)|nr:TIGR04086 family membrane protein [Lachnospiraceae bacterium]MDD3615744.1 TIGR04086 family membrane protein [Lachnospiraceae bacterium]
MEIKGKMVYVIRLMKAWLVAYAVTVILLLILAGILYKAGISENLVNIGTMAIYVISCFCGSVYLGKKMERQRFLWGFIQGIGYFLIVLAVGFIQGQELSLFSKDCLTSLALCMGGGMIGGMLS